MASVASAVSTKKDSVMDDVEPAASRTKSKERSTAMTKLLKSMALVCNSYEINLRKLVDEHEKGAREDINEKGATEDIHEKVIFVLGSLFYNVRGDCIADTSQHDVFTLKDMRDNAKMPAVAMKLGDHGKVFCSSLQIALWYRD